MTGRGDNGGLGIRKGPGDNMETIGESAKGGKPAVKGEKKGKHQGWCRKLVTEQGR